MNIVSFVLFSLLGAFLWAHFVYLVNEEIGKLQQLARDPEASSYSVGLKAPEWQFLRAMSLRRFWVILALILAPALVIAWGLSLILALLFVLLPMFIWETIQEIWWTIKKSSSRTSCASYGTSLPCRSSSGSRPAHPAPAFSYCLHFSDIYIVIQLIHD